MAAAVMLAFAAAPMSGSNPAFANGGGFGLGSDGTTRVQTYYANTYITNDGRDGTTNGIRGLRKFVDTLPGIPGVFGGANNLNQYMPLGVADTATYAGAAYYEIALVEYTERMHSDLVKATTLRGYVQIDPVATDAAAGITGNGGVSPAGSNRVALTNPDGSLVLISRPSTRAQAVNGFEQVQAYAVDKPHYLGPVIVAQRATPVRLKFYNALPSGRAVKDVAGNVKRNGDLFLPLDETLTGAGFGPDGMTKYTQNRTALHWHGGDTPWISDGTPHQWLTPAAEQASLPANMSKGASLQNVPDMRDPGPGAQTLYFPNNLSARLMFYHDHALAITRLNVYAGVAAGYLIQDPVEQALVAAGTLPATQIPLVIQDKTFVPSDVAQEDGLWDQKHWGTPGDLWYPHVYESNQDPASPDGTNPVGRWDYGPWFWPVFPAPLQLPTGAYGDVTTVPEGFMDTPVVNGTAYPTLTVDPKAYRLRILNAANDRLWNFAFFVADDTVATPDGRSNTEVKMVPFSGPNQPTAVTYSCPDGSGPGLNVGDVNAIGTVRQLGWTESGRNSAGATLYNNSFPCAGGLMGSGWGSNDNRPGGVPDPKKAGPDIIHIGTEGGFLPNPVVIPSTIANYEYNKRSVTVLNVLERGLFLGGAERADVVVDFSQYAGKTLILYNDSPAPLPAGDPRIDYYTDNGDQSGAGGAPNTIAGFGPNTRTVMQVVVSNTTPAAPFNVGAPADPVAGTPATGLFDALPKAYKASQDAPLIPQSAYNNAFGTQDGDNFATIYNGSSIAPNFDYTPGGTGQSLRSISVTSQGVGYTVAPTITLSGAGLVNPVIIAPIAGSAGAQVAGGKLISITVPNGVVNTGALSGAPKVTITSNIGPNGVKVGGGATAMAFTNMTKSLPVQNKAIQELFDPSYGRMNATLGVELPFTSPLNQTTIPLGFIDPATEVLNDGEVAIWKITHNGVDTHPVHFHLVNLQVLNRVGWDGTIKPPADNEQGWKETIKMNPLEDIYVAVKPRAPQIPFGVPESKRLMDPTQPVGSITGFTQIDPKTGVAPIDPTTGLSVQITNQMSNYGWEYVWHCHILGHEENDFMRPIIFNFGAVMPAAPTPLTASAYSGTGPVTLTWADSTPAAATTTPGNKQNEIGYKILRGVSGSVSYTQVGTALANATGFTDTPPAATGWNYQVIAYNAAGDSIPASVTAGTATPPVAPTAPTGALATVNGPNQITLTWADKSNNETGFDVQRAVVTGTTIGSYVSIAGVGASVPATATNGSITFVDTGLLPSTTYSYRVAAINKTTLSTWNVAANKTTTAAAVLNAPSNVMVQMTGTNTAQLTFTDLALNETLYVVQVSNDSGKSWGDSTVTNFTQSTPAYVASTTRTGTASSGSGTAVSIAVSNPNLTLVSGNTPYLFRVAAAQGSTANASYVDAATGNTVNFTTTATGALIGAWGNIATLDLSGQTVIAPATAFTATPTSLTALTLTWLDNAPNNASYLLQRSTDGGVTWTTMSSTLAGTATTSSVTGLTSGATYMFRLQAVGVGVGVASAFATATVTMPVMAAPTGLATASVGAAGLTLSWAAVTGATSYDVYGNGVLLGNSATTSLAVTGLTPNTTYSLVVIGKNAVGSSIPSAAKTQLTLPGAVAAAPTAGSITATGLTLAWAAPATGAASYTVQRATNAAFTGTITSTAATGTSLAVTGLAANTLYYFRVVAVNATGSGAASPVLTQVTVPAAPAPTTASVTSSGLTLNWTAPGGTGAITGYTVTGTGGAVISYTSGTTATVTGLSPSTSYTLSVVATNAAGSSAAGSVTATTAMLAPAAPTVSSVAATTMTVNWAAVTGATGYTLQYSTNGTTWTTLGTTGGGVRMSAAITAASTSANVLGLAAGTTYYFHLSDTTSAGASPYSSAVTQATLAATPATPTVTSTGVTSAGFTLNFAATGATSYNVTVGGVTTNQAASTLVVSGATPGTSYGPYTVQACSNNATTCSAASAGTSVSTLPDVPAAPTVSSVAATTMTVNWSAVTGATGYTLQYSTNGGTSWTTLGTGGGGIRMSAAITAASTSANITGLTANTSYSFHLLASNGSGSGAYSTAATQLTLPAAPTATASNGVTTDTAITGGLSFTVVAGLTYTVNWTSPTGALTPSGSSAVTASAQQLSFLSAGTYAMTLTATNASGSATSAAVNVTVR